MATRYAGDFEFDHGAQFFTARSAAFKDFLQPLIDGGAVSCWHARFAELDRDTVAVTRDWDDDYPHYVGAPGMNAVGRYLADGLSIRTNTTVARLSSEENGWSLSDEDGNALGHFDWVVCAMPAAQTAALVPAESSLHGIANGTEMRACYALMLGFEAPPPLSWQAALVRGADISWISVNSSKPRRNSKYTLVVHSTNAYADAHLDEALEDVQRHLLEEVAAVTGIDCHAAPVCQLQRWRYANVDKKDGPVSFVDRQAKLAGCGDWFRRGRVEAAFLSGLDVGEQLRLLVK